MDNTLDTLDQFEQELDAILDMALVDNLDFEGEIETAHRAITW